MHFDLIIVGGGIVGMTLATALRGTKLQLALIDVKPDNHEDTRLLALNEKNKEFFSSLGLWEALSPHATAIRQVHVSRQGYMGAVRLRCEEVNLPALGYVIPAPYIEKALNNRLLTQQNLTLYRPATLQALQLRDQRARLTVSMQMRCLCFETPIVIGADGADSTVRHLMNIKTKIIDYRQSAIVTRTLLHRDHQHIAYERFNTQGAIAMLPLMEKSCATIWSADNDTIARLCALDEEHFLQALQKEFGYRLGRLQRIKQRYVFPLKMIYAEKMLEQSVFLLGNAAHTLHPIAAQGLNLALYEVAVLADSLQRKTMSPCLLTANDWQAINQKIRKQKMLSMELSHHLAYVFIHRSGLKSAAFQFGMIGLDALLPLKTMFVKNILGRERVRNSLCC
jgi:2-octaprenyl-6-methoxyphenol hydroxylase